MEYSQSRLRPSRRYWSAALRRSCAMSSVTSTEPVYMYLLKDEIKCQTFTIFSHDRKTKTKSPTSSSAQIHPILCWGSQYLLHPSPEISTMISLNWKQISTNITNRNIWQIFLKNKEQKKFKIYIAKTIRHDKAVTSCLYSFFLTVTAIVVVSNLRLCSESWNLMSAPIQTIAFFLFFFFFTGN